jgi:hypothetical protein
MKINKNKNMLYWVISEASFFAFLYYVQYLLKVDESLWFSSFVLWALLNASIVFCPIVRRCYR